MTARNKAYAEANLPDTELITRSPEELARLCDCSARHFNRLFRDHFGVTPEAVRHSACLDHLKLQEPILMESSALDYLKPPRFETGKAMLVAGIGIAGVASRRQADVP